MLSALPFKPHPLCGSGKPDTAKEQLIPGLGNMVHELSAGQQKVKDIGAQSWQLCSLRYQQQHDFRKQELSGFGNRTLEIQELQCLLRLLVC